MKRILTAFAVILIATSGTIQAQSKDEAKYRKESEQMRSTVWAWDKPQFKVKTIPAEYANASKVIIAHHSELTANSKSKFAFTGLGFSLNKEQKLTEVVREIVKINDKNAVTEYSELSFTQFAKVSGFYNADKSTTYVGVRVVKPGGAIKEINADDIILVKDDKTEKQAKVAIPDLQPGDILDYFIATEQSLTNDMSNKAYRILLFDDAPMLSLSFHAELGKKYAIEYRSYNGAPELTVDKNDDKDIIVDVVKTNIKPFETSLWVAPGLQLPFIRLNISLGYKGMFAKYMQTKRPGEVSKNTDSDEYVDDVAMGYSASYINGYWMRPARKEYEAIESDAKRRAKKAGLAYKDWDDDEKAAQLYYTLRFTKLLYFNIDRLEDKINMGENIYNGIVFPMFATLKASGVDPAILVSTDRLGLRMSEIMSSSDLNFTTYLPGSNKIFSMRTIYDIPFVPPVEIEGATATKSFTFDHPAMIASMKKMTGLTNIDPGPNVPVSAAVKNAHIENLKLAVAADNNNLAVKRSTTLKGYYKADEQKNLILYEDVYEAERKALGEDKSLIEELEDGKRSKKYVDEVVSAFATARKKQKDAFIKEAKNWFEQEVTDLKDYRTVNLGIRHSAPDFIYSSTFNLGGLIKKAGNNLIVEIGKIQGQPLVIKDEQRKRDIDVYMPFARSIEYNITLDIPDGYTAEGVAAINKNVSNDAGFFKVEATATDKAVTINVKKHYLHNFEPAKNWDMVIAFTDAANEWVGAKLLLKKK